jgi:hypothetical protein
VPKEGQAPSKRPCVDAKSRYMPAAPEGPSKESRLKKSKDMDQTMESRDSSGPYLASETASLPMKTKNMAPEWRNSWQRRNRGNMALLNTLMWIMARLLEEEPAVSIGLLRIWTHPSKMNEATHQRVQEINRMADQEAIAMLENLQTQKYVHLAGKTGKLTMGLQLGVPGFARKIGVAALLDSGCDGSSIDHCFVKRNNIPTRKVANPARVLNADGTENKLLNMLHCRCK